MTTPGGSEPSGGPVATARQQFPKGYAQIADLHGKIPETIHLRTHTRLFVQVLLDKQARLQDLDEELRQQQLADQTSAIGKRSEYCRNFGLMRATGEGDEFEQRRILDDIEKIVVDYGRQLLLLSQLLALPGVNSDLKDLQDMLEEQDQNNEGLTGSDRKIWGLEERRKNRPRDLVSLRPRTYEDGFSKLVSDKLVPFAHTFYNPKVDEQLGFTASDDATVHEATRIFTIVVASLLPYVSIVILHVVKSMAKKLGILGGSSLLFSLSVSILTSASRAEVFAVTTAFLAVQVVFISNDGPDM